MKYRNPHELPEEQQQKLDYAKKLAWWSLFFLFTITVVIYLTMGSSQVMKTAWVEDIWSMIPPVMFLITLRVQQRKPSERYPYGFYNIGSLAFLSAATAVFVLGVYMLYDSARSLYQMEHPTIGIVEMFGYQFWSGWLMIVALIYSAIPPVILGYLKHKAAKDLHAKTMVADAAMNKADWTTAVAAILGIIGVGLGLWWADAVMAGLIAFEITRDGYTNLRRALTDLLYHRPSQVDSRDPDPLIQAMHFSLSESSWIKNVEIRMREEGMLLAGEIFVQPRPGTDCLIEKTEELKNKALNYHWRVYDVVVTLVPSSSEIPQEQTAISVSR